MAVNMEPTPRVRKRRLEKPDTLLERATGYLEAYEKTKSHKQHVDCPADTTGFVMATKVLRQETSIYTDNQTPNRHAVYVKLIASVLSSWYFHDKGYVTVSNKQLCRETGLTNLSLSLNLDYLMKTGLWGKIEGRGRESSRYYPLFNAKGMSEFLKVIEAVNNGCDPLTGELPKKKESAEAEEAPEKSEATEATATPLERVAPLPAVPEEAPAVTEGYFSDGSPLPDEPYEELEPEPVYVPEPKPIYLSDPEPPFVPEPPSTPMTRSKPTPKPEYKKPSRFEKDNVWGNDDNAEKARRDPNHKFNNVGSSL